MKFTIDRAALLRPLGHVQSVVERRNTIPILANVLLKAGNGRLSLTATDMDMDIVESVDCNVGADGALTVPAHTLYDIIRKLPDGSEVSLEATGEAGRVSVTAGRSSFTLPALPADEFPSMSGEELPHRFSMAAADAKSMIDRTRFAISNEETRYYLNGIYLHATEANDVAVMRAVATDGHRLARVEMPLPEGAAGMPAVIIPRKAINEIHKLIEDTEGEVSIALSDSKLCFAFGDTVLTTKLIDGTFPDYERVIPSGNDKTLQVNCKIFANAVDRVATISTEKSRSVKLQMDEGTLVLSASSPESGTAREELEVSYSAGPMEIGFNSRYLLDIANQIEGEGVIFSLADAASPTIVRDQDDDSSLYVLMPMRV
ncbi:MAG: DNA polymerase III subunit beta [Proteobacteria bacterium]|nr:DNA polymerase III subunit beta [Pseudomonadota bacterium]MDA1309324.1 DNA polymerase III subunit beta [Pseudomonadota bacterium]